MKKICRICLESHDIYYPVHAPLKSSNQCSINTILKMIIPQLYLGLTKDPVICDKCLKELDISHKFRLKCYETENKIGLFIRQHNTNATIELEQVLEYLKEQKNRLEKNLFHTEDNTVVLNSYSSTLCSIGKDNYESKKYHQVESTTEEVPTKKPKFVIEQPKKIITPLKVCPTPVTEDISVTKVTPNADPEPDKNPPDKKKVKEIRRIHFTLCPETGRFLRVPETIKTAKTTDPQQKKFPPYRNILPTPEQTIFSKAKVFKFKDIMKEIESKKVRSLANQQLQDLNQNQMTKISATKPDKTQVNAPSTRSILNTKEENKTNDVSVADDGVIIKPTTAEGNIVEKLVKTCNESEIKEEPTDFEELIDRSGGETTRSASETSFYEKVLTDEAGNLDSLLNQIPDIETEYDKPDYIKIANIDLQDLQYLHKNHPTSSTSENLAKHPNQEKDINKLFIKAPSSYQVPVKEDLDNANTVRLYTSYTKSGEYINDHDYLVNPYIRHKVLIRLKDGEKYSCYCTCMICGVLHKLESHSLHMANHNAFCIICNRDYHTSYMLNLHVRVHAMFCHKCKTKVAYQDRQHLLHHKRYIQLKKKRPEVVHEIKTVELDAEEYKNFRKEEEQEKGIYDPILKTFKTFNEWKKSTSAPTTLISDCETDTPEEKKESEETVREDKQESVKLEKDVPEISTPTTRSTKRKLEEEEMPSSENTTENPPESSENTPSTSEIDKNESADKLKQLKHVKKTEKSKVELPKKTLKTETNCPKRVLRSTSLFEKISATPVSSRTRFSKKS